MRISLAVLVLILLLSPAPLQAQEPARAMDVDAQPRAVTIYRGRASVTRTASWSLAPGMYELKFSGLPESVRRETIQARVNGRARVLALDYREEPAEVAASAQLAALDAEILEQEPRLGVFDEALELIRAQGEFLDALTVRATGDARSVGGTPALDLEVVRRQMNFIAEERAALITRRREATAQRQEAELTLARLRAERERLASGERLHRSVVVTVAVLDAGQLAVDLVYLVTEASWVPAYSVRAAANGAIVSIEYDALITQRTGEDWTDVELTLSTAEPTLAANPPTLEPWFLDTSATGAEVSPPRSPTLADALPPDEELLSGRTVDAIGPGVAPTVTYTLPRATTVRTNIKSQQRTRIANVDVDCAFTHVAIPLLTDAVYVRGALTNRSGYHLLPARASIFVGQDYVGPTILGSVPPGEQFDLYFGIDRAVVARRELIAKKTAKTGLLGGGRKTSYDYRIAVENASGKTIRLELWDRIPVSRSDQIEVELVDLSHPIVTAADYLEDERPQGLLKWVLGVPGTATGSAPFVLSYGVRVSRAKDVDMSPLPE